MTSPAPRIYVAGHRGMVGSAIVRTLIAHGQPADAILTRTQTASHTQRMRERIDSAEGRAQYGMRMATVEPVFANLRHNKRLNRFTLRGQHKVDGQWKLFALVHNIEKLVNNRKAA